MSAMALLQRRQEREGDVEEINVDEHMNFDLGRLAAFSHASVAKIDIANSKSMTERATETTQYIINRLFMLPSEPAEWGRLAHLPGPTTVLPREKPLPKPKVRSSCILSHSNLPAHFSSLLLPSLPPVSPSMPSLFSRPL
jgi:hypothetical protein